MRIFLVVSALFVALLGGGIYLKGADLTKPESTPVVVEATAEPTPEKPATLTPARTTPLKTQSAPVESSITKAAPPLSTSPCTKGGSCTPAEVALHSTRSDCYISMANTKKVYDITAYVSQNSGMHPGGDIADYCGTDISSVFTGATGEHRHSGRAFQDLLAYEFADLR